MAMTGSQISNFHFSCPTSFLETTRRRDRRLPRLLPGLNTSGQQTSGSSSIPLLSDPPGVCADERDAAIQQSLARRLPGGLTRGDARPNDLGELSADSVPLDAASPQRRRHCRRAPANRVCCTGPTGLRPLHPPGGISDSPSLTTAAACSTKRPTGGTVDADVFFPRENRRVQDSYAGRHDPNRLH